MNKLDRIGKIVNWTVFVYLVIISILALLSKITYGHGLGDITFFILSSAFAIIHLLILVIYIHARREPLEKEMGLVIVILFLLVAAGFTYKFTIGRGPENEWRGKVFESNNEIKVKVLALTPHSPLTGPFKAQCFTATGTVYGNV